MGWPTAQTVVVQAAQELGLVATPNDWGADVYQSQDINAGQLCALLKKVGRDIVNAAPWSHLRRPFSFYTTNVGLIQLPIDWKDMIDQSGWNRSTRLPLGGPLSDQTWEFLNARLAGVVFNVLFRPMQGVLQLYPPSNPSLAGTIGQTISLSYKSAWWVLPQSLLNAVRAWAPGVTYWPGQVVSAPFGGGNQPGGYDIGFGQTGLQTGYLMCSRGGTSTEFGSGPLSTGSYTYLNGAFIPEENSTDPTAPTWNLVGLKWLQANGAQGVPGTAAQQLTTPNFGLSDLAVAGVDTLMFDEELLVAGLKLEWLKGKGFDARDAQDNFRQRLDAAVGNDQAAPILDLSRGGVKLDVLLSQANLPITGYGGTS